MRHQIFVCQTPGLAQVLRLVLVFVNREACSTCATVRIGSGGGVSRVRPESTFGNRNRMTDFQNLYSI